MRVDDLLDVSRIDRGKLELRVQPVAIADVMKTGVDTARPNIDARGHALAVRYPAEPLYVDLVALTGMVQQGDIARTRAAGFDEHLTKPADLGRLSRLFAAT